MAHRYTVIIVGPRGSGKTVFLGSMYHKLSVPGEYGFYLAPDDVQRRRLVHLFSTMTQGEEWPPATVDVQEWKFSCNVISPTMTHHTAFDLSYYDYSGGRITDAEQDNQTFQKILDEADCLLGILDGQKLAGSLNGQGVNQLEMVDLPNILPILNKGRSPVHLVISKWDLLEGLYTLEQVRDKLLSNPQFKNFVRGRNLRGIPVRLIPVSAVGKGFATWQNNMMKKAPGRVPQPFQVEMPMAMILPDKVQAEIARLLREMEEKKKGHNDSVEPVLTLRNKVGDFFGGTFRMIREFLPEKYQFTDGIFRRLAERAERGAQAKREEAARSAQQRRMELEASLQAVQDEKSALDYALTSFGHIQRQLDFVFPASEILLPP